MKLKGFTLAEILIAMGIIGVLTAILVPSLSRGADTKKNIAKIATDMNTVENAIGSMILNENVNDFSETEFYSNLTGNRIAEAPGNLSRYMKLILLDDDELFTSSWNPGATFGNGNFEVSSTSGTSIRIYTTPRRNNNINYYGVIFDVNGTKSPNRAGFDQFIFTMDGTYGTLYAGGSNEWNSVYGGNWPCPNSIGNTNGVGCTNRMINDGYKINYNR